LGFLRRNFWRVQFSSGFGKSFYFLDVSKTLKRPCDICAQLWLSLGSVFQSEEVGHGGGRIKTLTLDPASVSASLKIVDLFL
jgi:hypothetical protein